MFWRLPEWWKGAILGSVFSGLVFGGLGFIVGEAYMAVQWTRYEQSQISQQRDERLQLLSRDIEHWRAMQHE